jgi:hypothetical protein
MRTQFLKTCLILKVNMSVTANGEVRTDAMEIVNIRFHDTECLSRIKMYKCLRGESVPWNHN